MAKFESVIDLVTDRFEGGYQNFANDNGNWIVVNGKKTNIGTNHGIAGTTFAEYRKMKGLPVPTSIDVKNMSKSEAVTIFKTLFWDKYSFSDIKYQGIAEFLFDMSLGSQYWVKWCNKALNEFFNVSLPTSNTFSFGKRQIDLINSTNNPLGLLQTLKKYRVEWYKAIVKADSSQAGFLNSWLNRTNYMFDKWKNSLTDVIDETKETVKKNPKTTLFVTVALIGLLLIAMFGIKKYIAISASTPII